jgi:hypothetical protein
MLHLSCLLRMEDVLVFQARDSAFWSTATLTEWHGTSQYVCWMLTVVTVRTRDRRPQRSVQVSAEGSCGLSCYISIEVSTEIADWSTIAGVAEMQTLNIPLLGTALEARQGHRPC